VGAPEDEGVDPRGAQRVEVAVRRREQLVPARHAVLDEVHEPRTGLRAQLDVRCGRERVLVGHRVRGGPGADHADPAGPAGGDRAPGRGIDHLDDGDVVALPGVPQHRRAGGVAGDDQGLDPLGVEVVETLQGVLAHLADRLGAVRLAGGVPEIAHRLVRQLVDDRPGDRQPAEPGVEDPDRRVDRVVERGHWRHNGERRCRWGRRHGVVAHVTYGRSVAATVMVPISVMS
jgi:hypothetical protein